VIVSQDIPALGEQHNPEHDGGQCDNPGRND
jgi:hypothetical protein